MALPVVMAAIAGAAGIAKTAIGASQARRARQALDKFKRQELTNIAEGMTVSTLGAELQTQEAQRRFATSVDALQSGGVRGVVGGLAQQEAQQQQLQRQIAADLDRQQMAIEQVRAQDEARIQGMREQRESFDYQQLLGQQAAGRQMIGAGIGDIAGAGMFLAGNLPGKSAATATTSTLNVPKTPLPTQGIQMPITTGSTIGYNPNAINPLTGMQNYLNPLGGGQTVQNVFANTNQYQIPF
jgi:hypothetical protein